MYKALSPGALGLNLPFEQCVALARKNGFDGIYFDVRWAADIGPEKAKEVLDGLKPACFGLPFDYKAEAPEFTERVLELAELVPAAKALGCARCSTWIPSWHDQMDYTDNFMFHRRRLQWIANTLAQQQISFGLEFLGPKTLRDGHKYEFVHDMSEMLRLCYETGVPNLGLLLDSWHWYTSGGTLDDLRKLNANQVIDVHINDAPAGVPVDKLKDNIRALPGETGVINVKGFLAALDFIGYKGPVMAEPFSEKVKAMPPEQAVAVTAEAINSVWPAA